jgi:hypothetical protein
MSKVMPCFTCVVVLAVFATASYAKLVSFEADTLSSWSPSGAVVTQSIGSAGRGTLTMSAESRSKFTLTSVVTNETSFVWTGYLLSLNPAEAALFVDHSASSTKFNTVLYPDKWHIQFKAPNEVAIGQVVALQFDILIPDDGSFTFTLTQTPIPEPATFALLGLGALACLRRRRR